MNISKNDIQKFYDDKQLKKKKIYNKILIRICRLMKETAEKGKNMCMFIVPEIILGMPIYNTKECMYYIEGILKEKDFETTLAEPNIIMIFWKLENKLIKVKHNKNMIENKVSDNKIPRMYNQNNILEKETKKDIEYNSVKNIDIPQTFFFNH